jgi:phenylpyruvate tautomerase PptA (4-oxalocrotonate tautomerase family)
MPSIIISCNELKEDLTSEIKEELESDITDMVDNAVNDIDLDDQIRRSLRNASISIDI